MKTPLIRYRANEGRVGRLVARLSLWLAIGAASTLALMMYIVFADVIGRYFLNRPISGSNEIIYCLMGLLVFLGMGLCTYEGGHVRVDILTNVATPRLRAALDVLAHALSSVAAILICWRLFIAALDQMHDLNVTQVLELPVWLVTLVMAISGSMLVVCLLLHFASAVRQLFHTKSQS